MDTKQNPVVKVGDKLIFTYGGTRKDSYTVEFVLKVTPTGLVKTETYTMSPDLAIRGLGAWSRMHSRAELATPERLAEIEKKDTESRCRYQLKKIDWDRVSSNIVMKLHTALGDMLKEEKEAKDAEESK